MREGGPDVAGVIAPPPLIYFLSLLIGLVFGFFIAYPFLPSLIAIPLGALLFVLGIALLTSGSRALAKAGTPVVPSEPTKTIVTSGPYRFTRNPLYLGFTLIYLGVTFGFNSTAALILLVPTLLVIERGVIHREERYLERKFGEQYTSYKKKVRRWV